MINKNLAAVMIKQKRKLKVMSLNINEIPNGYVPLNKLLESPNGKMEFLNDLQKKVLDGISEVTGDNFNKLTGTSEEDQKKLQGD